MSSLKPPYLLRVMVLRLKDLPKDYIGRPVYVIMELGNVKFKTDSIERDPNPCWNQECQFEIHSYEDLKQSVNLHIVAKKTSQFKESTIGVATIPLMNLGSGIDEGWFSVEKRNTPTNSMISCTLLPSQITPSSHEGKPTKNLPKLKLIGNFRKKSHSMSADAEEISIPPQTPSTQTTFPQTPLPQTPFPSENVPEISGISPNFGPLTGKTHIQIRGQRLGISKEDIVELKVAGIDCESITYVSETKIFCTTKPSQAPRKGPIEIKTNSGGKSQSQFHFEYTTPIEKVIGLEEKTAVVEEKTILPEEKTLSKKELTEKVHLLQNQLKEKDVEIENLRKYIEHLLIRIVEKDPEILERVMT